MEGGRALRDAHLRRDETAPKMGHPDLWAMPICALFGFVGVQWFAGEVVEAEG
jgi:hypothetical protein